jgi:hypothetical protein
MPSSEEKNSLLLNEIDEQIFFVRLLTKVKDTKLPPFVEETEDHSNGTFIYALKLRDLREHAEDVCCPSAGQYYLDWMDFEKLLLFWMGEDLYFTLVVLWKLLL